MDPWFLLILAAIIAVAGVGIGVAARRGGGDRPDDRGPYSSGAETTGSFAAMGTIVDRSGDGDADSGDGGDGGGD